MYTYSERLFYFEHILQSRFLVKTAPDHDGPPRQPRVYHDDPTPNFRGRPDHDPSKFSGGGGGGDGSGSGTRTPLSLALEGKAVQPRDKVDVLGVTLMRIVWLLDGKGLEVLYKAQIQLLDVLNTSWLSWMFPSAWCLAITVPIPKCGKDLTEASSYITISLSNISKCSLDLVHTRTTHWGLMVSAHKSSLLCFTRRCIPNIPTVTTDGSLIPFKLKRKFLGLLLDSPPSNLGLPHRVSGDLML
ncbi:hypothetical protein E2C01_035836 [Portunus trituberculatus]|uniref:Uncharacterized protein n=1 Tax=Portunus trituberculatus TaxID=210409 RepID=A0A5B7F481_PORTR|nr:hypothetical protein [Portunus trituberculatus]